LLFRGCLWVQQVGFVLRWQGVKIQYGLLLAPLFSATLGEQEVSQHDDHANHKDTKANREHASESLLFQLVLHCERDLRQFF
jgi:hypothetical protein